MQATNAMNLIKGYNDISVCISRWYDELQDNWRNFYLIFLAAITCIITLDTKTQL